MGPGGSGAPCKNPGWGGGLLDAEHRALLSTGGAHGARLIIDLDVADHSFSVSLLFLLAKSERKRKSKKKKRNLGYNAAIGAGSIVRFTFQGNPNIPGRRQTTA
jgi:hypothetical protein